MINSESNTVELMTNIAGPTTFIKQPVLAPKKVALRDIQNNNNNLKPDPHQETLIEIEKQPFINTSKTCGTKRLTPDYTSTPVLTNNAAHEHLTYPRRKYEFERNNGKTTEKTTGYSRSQMGSKTSAPRFKEEQRIDRFIRLQNFIKQCDGSNNRENIQFLLRLSPSDLSRHAVELEKRAIQLTIEEGKEMQRMEALNILGKPSTTRNQMPIRQDNN